MLTTPTFILATALATMGGWEPAMESPAQHLAQSEKDSDKVPTGRFSYAGGESEWRTIKEKIDEVTKELLIGGLLAKEKLEDMLRPSSTLSMTHEPDTFVVQTQRDRIAAPLGGTGHYKAPDGSEFTVRHISRARKLVQILRNGDGKTRKVFDLDGDVLRVRVRIEDERLPEPLAFTMTYRRRS